MHECGCEPVELGSAHHMIFIFCMQIMMNSKNFPSAKKKVAAVKRKAKDKTQDSANRWLSIPETLEEGVKPDMAQHDEEEIDAHDSPDFHHEKCGAEEMDKDEVDEEELGEEAPKICP